MIDLKANRDCGRTYLLKQSKNPFQDYQMEIDKEELQDLVNQAAQHGVVVQECGKRTKFNYTVYTCHLPKNHAGQHKDTMTTWMTQEELDALAGELYNKHGSLTG